MSTEIGSLKYTLQLDDAGFAGKINEDKEKVSTAGKGMSSSLNETSEAAGGLKGAFSSMAGQFVIGQAVFTAGQKALEGVTDIIKGGIQSAKDWQQQQVGMRQELKSTGDASGMTADQIKALAEETENKTAIDKASVLTGQNMLLTFTNIGKGAFPLATQAMVDMATRMNGGMIPSGQMLSSTAIQLGKALNDPTTGLNALHRVGVTFTDDQKKQIQTLQASGDMMGAQKIILNELGREFGGAASANLKSFTGQWALLKNRLEDAIGDNIPKVIAALQKVGDWIVNHKPVMVTLIGVIAGLAIAIGVGLVMAIGSMIAAAAPLILTFTAIGAVAGAAGYLIYSHWNSLKHTFEGLKPYIDDIKVVFSLLWQAIRGGDVTLTSSQFKFAGLVKVILNVREHVQELAKVIKDIVVTAWHLLQKAVDGLMPSIKALVSTIASNFVPVMLEIWQAVVRLWQALQPALMDALKIIAIVIGGAVYASIWLWINALRIAIDILAFLVRAITDVVKWLANIISWLGTAAVFMYRLGDAVVDAIGKAVGWFVNLQGKILGALAGAGSWLYDIGKDIIQGLIHGIENMAGAVEDKVKSVANGIKNVAKKILGIFSPSKVFDEEIGQQITAGLASGIDKGSDNAVKSTTQMTSKVVGAGNSALKNVQPFNINNNQNQGINYNFGQGSVILQTAEAVNAFFNIGNRSTQLELMGGSPLAGTSGV